MQRPKQKRYWAGKAPDWVEEEDEAPQAAAAAAAAGAAAAPLPAAAAAADPRLMRLTQRQGASGERRGPSEAVVVQRRRQRSPSPEEEEEREPERGLEQPVRRHQQEQQQEQQQEASGSEEEEEEDDEEAIAARRMAIRARQLAAAAEVAGAASGEEEEESSEYTTDDESEEDDGPVMLKPAFVPKTERETLTEAEALLAAAEQTTRQHAADLEERKRQTQELVVQAQLQEAQQAAPVKDDSDFDTSDEADEVAQYEAWRERELLRIARDRQLRQAGTKAEAAAAAAKAGGLPAGASFPAPKKKWKFLQKYYHKGAFFQGDEEEGEEPVLGDVLRRDFDGATGEDKFDKQMLPKIMQVRNFGRRGRTKWTHLLAEDTTMQQAADFAVPAAGARQPSQQVQDFSKPRRFKT